MSATISHPFGEDELQEPLFRAAKEGQEEDIILLLDQRDATGQRKLLLCIDQWGRTALMRAALYNKLNILRLIKSRLDDAAWQDLVLRQDFEVFRTGLTIAVMCGFCEAAKFLLSSVSAEVAKKLIYVKDDRDRTVLHWIAITGQRSTPVYNFITERLNSAERNELMKCLDHRGRTAFHWAAMFARADIFLEMCSILSVDQRQNLIAITDNFGCTVFHLCSFKEDNMISCILSKVNCTASDCAIVKSHLLASDEFGNTSLHYAALFRRRYHMEIILSSLDQHSHDAFINQPNNDRYSAMDLIFLCDLELDRYSKEYINKLDLQPQMNFSADDQCRSKNTAERFVKFYDISKANPGTALFITSSLGRVGWEKERAQFTSAMCAMGFNRIVYLLDKPPREIPTRLRDALLKGNLGSQVWVFVASHGSGTNTICHGVEELHLQEIVNVIKENVPDGIPKIICLQFCRTPRAVSGVQLHDEDAASLRSESRQLALGRDMYVIYSTKAGTKLKRGLLAKWVKQCFTDAYAGKCSFGIFEISPKIKEGVYEESGHRQDPEYTHTLTKCLPIVLPNTSHPTVLPDQKDDEKYERKRRMTYETQKSPCKEA